MVVLVVVVVAAARGGRVVAAAAGGGGGGIKAAQTPEKQLIQALCEAQATGSELGDGIIESCKSGLKVKGGQVMDSGHRVKYDMK